MSKNLLNGHLVLQNRYRLYSNPPPPPLPTHDLLFYGIHFIIFNSFGSIKTWHLSTSFKFLFSISCYNNNNNNNNNRKIKLIKYPRDILFLSQETHTSIYVNRTCVRVIGMNVQRMLNHLIYLRWYSR